MATKEVTFINIDESTGFFYEDTVTATVVDRELHRVDSGWYIIEGDITAYYDYFYTNNDVKIILADDCLYKGKIFEVESGSLKIYGQKNGSGSLRMESGYLYVTKGKTLSIVGGKVYANCSESQWGHAAIGGNTGNDASDITIWGGDVFAYGGVYSAGIGSGDCAVASNITIHSGMVEALGRSYAAGIGSGSIGSAHDITIDGGYVKARGWCSGAGIGAGPNNYNNDTNGLEFNGGYVWAIGADDWFCAGASGAGIGSGWASGTDTVRINGGTVIAEDANDGQASSIGGGGSDLDTKWRYAKAVYVSGDMKLVIDGDEIAHTSSDNLNRTFENTEKATITAKHYELSDEQSIEAGWYTREGGYFGNGGYYYLKNGADVTGTDVAFYDIAINNGTADTAAFADGGVFYIENGAKLDLMEAEFSGNKAVGNNDGARGGAIWNDGTVTLTDTVFTGNFATCYKNDSYGGALYNAADGIMTLKDVTFADNLATTAGGAVYNLGTVNLTGEVTLTGNADNPASYHTDTIVNQGTFNWDLTGSSGSTGHLSDYSFLNNDGNLTITVNPNDKFLMSFALASNASNAADKSFTLTGISGEDDKTITVGGDTITYNDVKYTLSLNSSSELVLEAAGSCDRIVVSDELTLSNFEAQDLSNPDLDGGVFMVANTGTLSVFDAVFTTNTGNNGGVIYNDGTTTLKDITFNGNVSSDGQSGAVYNTGTLILGGDVTLSTESDTIYNSGNLVWNITPTDYGYLSDWSKLTNTGTATFKITGVKGNKCGQYTLVSNAASATGTVFTFEVGDTEKTITVDGEIVDLNGTYYGRLSVDSHNDLILTVVANRIEVGAGDTFSIQDGMVLDGEQTSEPPEEGGVFCVQKDGTLTNDGTAVIRGFSATDGGAICSYGTVSLNNVTFENNQSGRYGGAIGCFPYGDETCDTTLKLDHTVFSENRACNDGGAIYFAGKSVTITNSVFEQNVCEKCGGAISLASSEVILTNVVFNGNYTSSSGGGIYTLRDKLYLDNVVFNGNGSGDESASGAIYNTGSFLYLVGNVILATNTDTIYISKGRIIWQLDHGKNGYISNYALVSMDPTYPATYIIDTANADVNTSYVLAGNAASADQQSFTLFDGTITVNGNSVGKDGTYYTLYTDGNNDLRISISQRMVVDGETAILAKGMVFTNNGTAYSGNGGAVEVKSGGTLIVPNAPVIFRNNAATGNGGAICNGGTATLRNVIFTGNTATGNGGAIFNDKAGTINIAGSVTLSTDTDTLYNMGTLNWALTGGITGTLVNYQCLTNNDGSLCITVVAGQRTGDFVIATGNFSNVSGKKTFTITGADVDDVTITIGETEDYNGQHYALTVSDNGTEAVDDDQLILSIRNYCTLTSASSQSFGGVTFTIGGTEVTQAAEGETVMVTAAAAEEGYTFVGFTSDEVVIVDNAFTMPDGNVTVTANYYKEVTADDTNKYLDGTDVVITSGTTSVMTYGGTNNVKKAELTGSYSIVITSDDANTTTYGDSFAAGDKVNGCNVNREGDITLVIEGGIFEKRVAGGMYYTGDAGSGSATLVGNIYFTIEGGTFNERIYGGNNAKTDDLGANTILDGSVYLTIDAQSAISFSEHIVAGSRGAGVIKGSTTVTFTGAAGSGEECLLKFAENSIVFGGCSGDFAKKNSEGTEISTTVVGERNLIFSGFSGDFNAQIMMFSTATFAGDTGVNFLDEKLDMWAVDEWNFEYGSSASGLAKNDFTGDILNFDLTDYDGSSDWNVLSGAVDAFTGFDKIQKVNFGGTAEATYSEGVWTDGIYKLALNNDGTKTAMIVSKLA